MLLTRRKRKEQKQVAVYLTNKAIPQVQKLKFLGIIFNYKLTFRYHINYIAEKCTKLIFALARSAKIKWGLGHKALKTIYKRNLTTPAIRCTSMDKGNGNKKLKNKVTRVKRLINMTMVKTYFTVSSEALCGVTGMVPIHFKIEEAAELYLRTRSHIKNTEQFDNNKEARFW
jgi:hypothetical protein